MANFDNIIQEINTNLPDNNTQSITAAKLRTTLIDLTTQIDTVQDDFEEQINASVDGIIVDSLNSTNVDKGLSANQGRDLASVRNQIIFNGNDADIVMPPRIPIESGHTYRIKISNVDLSVNNFGQGPTYSKLYCGVFSDRTGGTAIQQLVSVTRDNPIEPEYEVIVQELSEEIQPKWLSIQMRFDAGQETVVSVEDITEINNISVTVNELIGEPLDVFSNGESHSARYILERNKYYVNCNNTNQTSPYVAASSSSLTMYCIIDVSGFKYIKFNSPLYASTSTSTPAGWAFYTSNNYTGATSQADGGFLWANTGYIEGAWDKFGKNTTTSTAQKEMILEVPENAKYFKTCISLSNGAITKNDFYCYLYNNASIKETIETDVTLDFPDFYIDTWTSNTIYVKGNQVQNEEKYYYCTTGHTSSSTFNISDGWSEITDFKFDCLNRYRFNKLQVGEKYYNIQSPIVDIVAFATSGTNVVTDEIYYNTNEHRLRRRFASGANFYTIPYYKGVFYRYNNEIYIWNGSDLVKAVNVPNSSTFAILENDTMSNRNISCADIVFGENPKLLLTGASFAVNTNNTRNIWFETGCQTLGVTPVNKAIAGTSITDSANSAYKGILWDMEDSTESNYIDSFDALVIMHVLNYDVMDNSLFRNTVTEYEANPDSNAAPGDLFYVDPNSTHNDRSSATISRSYDYVIKKYIDDCLSRKDVEGSIYYGKPYGKPVQIIMCTSWHDGRSLFNNSIRKLAASWGFPLVQFDANIGFTKNKPLSNGKQVSRIYSHGDTETINGVIYGWHPMFNSDLANNYTQMKMTKIFENSFK